MVTLLSAHSPPVLLGVLCQGPWEVWPAASSAIQCFSLLALSASRGANAHEAPGFFPPATTVPAAEHLPAPVMLPGSPCWKAPGQEVAPRCWRVCRLGSLGGGSWQKEKQMQQQQFNKRGLGRAVVQAGGWGAIEKGRACRLKGS